MTDQNIHYAETTYGFEYGSSSITRIHSDKKTGAVYLGIKTPRQDLQVYVTKTGKVRVFGEDGKEWRTR